MKKLLISLVMLIPFVSGCANIETQVNINKDKTASVVSSVTYEGNLSDSNDYNAMIIASNYAKLLDKYYTVDTAYSKHLSTITATKQLTNVEKEDIDLESLGFKTNLPSGKFVDFKKNFLVKSFNVDMEFDYPAVKERLVIPPQELFKPQTPKADPDYYNKYKAPERLAQDAVPNSDFDMAANLDSSVKQLSKKQPKKDKAKNEVKKSKPADSITFSISLPAFASYNNADNVNGFIYSWNIKPDDKTVIKLQYVQYSGWALFFVILAGMLLLIYVAKRFIRRDSTKRLDNIENIV